MNMLIAAGGTGGHLFPGIAVAESLKSLDPGGQVSFVTSERGLEEEILKREGLARVSLSVGRLKGEGWWDRIRTMTGLPRAVRRAGAILEGFQPDMVLGVGGYSSGPVVLAACLKGIPRAILEPNAVPGLTNRLLSRFVDRIFIAFPEAGRFFPRKKVVVTGTPVRKKMTEIGQGRSKIPPGGDFTILVIGGSQGASSINRAVVETLPVLVRTNKNFRWIHQTGDRDYERVVKAYKDLRLSAQVASFIADMAAAFRGADLVISRAGASSLAEIIETGSPSLLVPYPFAADDHQRFNALSVVEAGGAEMIRDRDLGNLLAKRLLHFESNREELMAMRRHLAQMRKVPAAEAVARECLKLTTGIQ